MKPRTALIRAMTEDSRRVHTAPLTPSVNGRHGDNARPAPHRALLTPEPPQDEEHEENKTSPKYSSRDPTTSSLYMPLSLQTQQVPEALFIWDVI